MEFLTVESGEFSPLSDYRHILSPAASKASIVVSLSSTALCYSKSVTLTVKYTNFELFDSAFIARDDVSGVASRDLKKLTANLGGMTVSS